MANVSVLSLSLRFEFVKFGISKDVHFEFVTQDCIP